MFVDFMFGGYYFWCVWIVCEDCGDKCWFCVVVGWCGVGFVRLGVCGWWSCLGFVCCWVGCRSWWWGMFDVEFFVMCVIRLGVVLFVLFLNVCFMGFLVWYWCSLVGKQFFWIVIDCCDMVFDGYLIVWWICIKMLGWVCLRIFWISCILLLLMSGIRVISLSGWWCSFLRLICSG